jgi:CheY-like chemotaxis protein/nitrogen-specific signal transduction histidine kinase
MISWAIFAGALLVVLWQLRRLNRARLAAQAANTAKSEFVANMSHELRTPLNAILGMAEMLAETELNEGQRGMLDIVRGSAETLLTLINRVLEFASLEAGHVQLDRTAFALRSCVDSVVGLVRPQAVAKNLNLDVSIAGDVPNRILGDPLRLQQVLLNLLGNAIKFTETGRVKLEIGLISPALETRALLFRVADTGIGIDSETVARLFTPFTQADSGSTRRYEGTGLGLATVRRLVQLMQGSMGVESEPGRGSTFWFWTPLELDTVSDADSLSQNTAPPRSPPRARVLIVDDNAVNRLVAQRALERLGYATELADGGERALTLLKETPGGALRADFLQETAPHHAPFDAILLDCQMPKMDGYQTAMAIRYGENHDSRIPIIALTANSSPEDRARCLECGMDDYLSKPLRPADLEAVLKRLVVTPGRRISSGPAIDFPACSKSPGPPSGYSPTPLHAPRLRS